MTAPSTFDAALALAARRIDEAGSDSPRLDAELIMAHALGTERTWLLAHGRDPIAGDQWQAVDQLVKRREQLEPVAYILGRRGFRNVELLVDRRVLIPRPETELLVQVVLDEIERLDRNDVVSIVDAGTGSGAIAIAVADEAMRAARIVATDISADALDVARANVDRCAVNVDVRLGSLLEPVEGETFDIVVSNPPYVATTDADSLMPDVRDHEPHVALFAGDADGYSIIRGLIDQSTQVLAPGGLLAIEVGHEQAEAVTGLVSDAGFSEVTTVDDLQGIPRIVTGRRSDRL